ncbi:cyclopropane-fatty-acyl-phospholipid synthase [Micromonospora sp. ATCC 39149]|uniref:Class I SAM-dependent methyltransferase n=1 Tax=Micromonospora carbonacea TaxID=47853 RepID=A0A7D6CFI1_9ACTN|nr:cyclopropane-fatty-acyl-phospholipid synthase family protein [Micromonospora sp. ATCC 39149]EEP70549.1 cyclopropane-fatty-acyl-phospholipid synthase [Micromonospora sp. ATCC 39149]QLJ96931.1 class I SAM-dependent methyltransferase [Micromonospora carbonacea]
MSTAAYAGASPAAIGHHYDLSNDFYALWLGESMVYSCARWADAAGDGLTRAQTRKLDYFVEQTRAAGTRRVLDVGCGWGTLVRHLVDRHGVARATGLTLSPAQARWCQQHPAPRTDVRVENWVTHEPGERYDAIISLGAFEHFARYGMTPAERLTAYRAFFERCRGWLPAGGRLGVQTNIKGNNQRLDRRTVRDMLFIVDSIFPESVLPALDEVIVAAAGRFDVVSVRNDPDDYARTCAAWLDRLTGQRDRAVELVGEDRTADYERYLSSTVQHFRRRHLGLARIVFEAV